MYNIHMKHTINHSFTLFKPLNSTMVYTLYALSEKCLTTAIIFTAIITAALYPELGLSIILWGSTVIFLSLLRLFSAYLFKKEFKKYTIETWYKIFVILSLLTGLSVSVLGFWHIHSLNNFYQLFVLSALLGLTAGASISLASDYKLAILYISIIILPLIISLSMQDTPLYIIVPILLLIFFISQIIMILKNYAQEEQINELLETNQNLLNENKLFIADMVHQIKTPLTTIMLNTSIMDMKSDSETSSNIRQINSAISMLNNAFEDLSYIISDESIEYKAIEIDFTQFLHDRVEFFKDIIEDNHKTVQTHISEGINISINDIELERLIDNNITNAIKHSKEKSAIKITLEQTPTDIILKFISEGKAINDVYKIFEKNYTENHSAKRSLGFRT